MFTKQLRHVIVTQNKVMTRSIDIFEINYIEYRTFDLLLFHAKWSFY